MELSVPKVAMVLAVVTIVGGGGAWAYANAQMEGRLASVRNEARAIGYARGGRLPTNQEVEAQVRAIAEAQHVGLEGLSVQMRTERGIGGIGNLVPQLGESLTGTTRVYEIRATGTTSALAWSLTEPLAVDLSLRNSVRVRAEGGGGSVQPRMPTQGASTDVHGGLSDEETGARYGQ